MSAVCLKLYNLSYPNGYENWKHISNLLIEHATSEQHRQSMLHNVGRSTATGRVDRELLFQISSEVNDWKNVLKNFFCISDIYGF